MTTTISHAPRVNSVTTKIRVTTALATKAVAAVSRSRVRVGLGCLEWYLTMPAPAMVKPVKTVHGV